MRESGRVGGPGMIVAGGLAALVSLTAGCGSTIQTSTRPALVEAHHAARHDGQRAKAGDLARRLLADLRLPNGARRVPWRMRPRILGPGVSAPVTDVIDMWVLYRLSQTMGQADAFLTGHVRGGLLVGDRGETSHAGMPAAAQANFSPPAPPRGIYLEELTIGLAPAVGGGSLLRVDAYVAWYPARTAAEHIDASKYRAVTVTAPARGTGSAGTFTRTFTRPSAVARMAAIANSLPAMPHATRQCPGMSVATSYSLAFTPAVPRRPRIVVATLGCSVYAVTVGGRGQPPLYEGGSKLTNAIRRLVGPPAA